MNQKSNLESLFKGIINRSKMADGKVIGATSEIIKEKLAADDRGAWVNHLADQYLKKEEMDTPPVELSITDKEVMQELLEREIDKILGK